jgi:hypothetical protein
VVFFISIDLYRLGYQPRLNGFLKGFPSGNFTFLAGAALCSLEDTSTLKKEREYNKKSPA